MEEGSNKLLLIPIIFGIITILSVVGYYLYSEQYNAFYYFIYSIIGVFLLMASYFIYPYIPFALIYSYIPFTSIAEKGALLMLIIGIFAIISVIAYYLYKFHYNEFVYYAYFISTLLFIAVSLGMMYLYKNKDTTGAYGTNGAKLKGPSYMKRLSDWWEAYSAYTYMNALIGAIMFSFVCGIMYYMYNNNFTVFKYIAYGLFALVTIILLVMGKQSSTSSQLYENNIRYRQPYSTNVRYNNSYYKYYNLQLADYAKYVSNSRYAKIYFGLAAITFVGLIAILIKYPTMLPHIASKSFTYMTPTIMGIVLGLGGFALYKNYSSMKSSYMYAAMVAYVCALIAYVIYVFNEAVNVVAADDSLQVIDPSNNITQMPTSKTEANQMVYGVIENVLYGVGMLLMLVLLWLAVFGSFLPPAVKYTIYGIVGLIAAIFVAIVCKRLIFHDLRTGGYTQGGKMVLSVPTTLAMQHNIGNYEELNDGKVNYNFAISCFVYINSQREIEIGNRYMSILNFGHNPEIEYCVSNNTLRVTMMTDHKRQVVCSKSGILLQKWNNIIVNYAGGTVDVFINGELEQSTSGIVPYITNYDLTIGTKTRNVLLHRLHGRIRDIVYFNRTLSKIDIYYLYNINKWLQIMESNLRDI